MGKGFAIGGLGGFGVIIIVIIIVSFSHSFFFFFFFQGGKNYLQIPWFFCRPLNTMQIALGFAKGGWESD